MNKRSSPDAKVKQQHTLVEFKAGYSNGSCCPNTLITFRINSIFEITTDGRNSPYAYVHTMSSCTPSVSAVIRLVNAPPAFRIDVVGPDPPPVLLLRPSAGWARSSAGPLLLDLRVVRAASIHRSTVASLRVTGTRVRHDMAGGAPARSTPQ